MASRRRVRVIIMVAMLWHCSQPPAGLHNLFLGNFKFDGNMASDDFKPKFPSNDNFPKLPPLDDIFSQKSPLQKPLQIWMATSSPRSHLQNDILSQKSPLQKPLDLDGDIFSQKSPLQKPLDLQNDILKSPFEKRVEDILQQALDEIPSQQALDEIPSQKSSNVPAKEITESKNQISDDPHPKKEPENKGAGWGEVAMGLTAVSAAVGIAHGINQEKRSSEMHEEEIASMKAQEKRDEEMHQQEIASKKSEEERLTEKHKLEMALLEQQRDTERKRGEFVSSQTPTRPVHQEFPVLERKEETNEDRKDDNKE